MRISKHYRLLHSAARTTSSNTRTTPTDVSGFREGNFKINCTAATGTNPTLDVSIDTWDETTNTWSSITTFTQLIATGSELKTVATNLGQSIAVSWVIGGTNTPTFTFSVSCDLKD